MHSPRTAQKSRPRRAPTLDWTLLGVQLEADLVLTEDIELRARRLVERLALVLQGSLLVRHAPAAVADAFCASRLAGDHGLAFGTLAGGADFGGVLERVPALHWEVASS